MFGLKKATFCSEGQNLSQDLVYSENLFKNLILKVKILVRKPSLLKKSGSKVKTEQNFGVKVKIKKKIGF